MKELKFLKPYFFKYKYRILLGLITMTISNVFSASIPKFIGNAIDAIKSGANSDSLLEFALIIIGLAMGSGLFSFFTRQCIIVVSRYVEYDIRRDYYTHVASLPMNYFTKTPTGDIMALATNDIPQIREVAGPAIMYSVNTLTTIIFSLALMIMLSVKITLFALIPLPIVSYAVYRFGRKIYNLSKRAREQFSDITSFAQEDISGVRVNRAYNRESYAKQRFEQMSLEYKTRNLALVKIDAAMQPTMISLIGISQIMVLLVGGYETIHQKITLGQLAQFFSYINQLIWPVVSIGWISNMFQRANASIARMKSVFDVKPEEQDNKPFVNLYPEINISTDYLSEKSQTDQNIIASNKIQNQTNPKFSDGVGIEFRNVFFRYAEDLPYVLKNVSFTIAPTQTLAVLGSTGSGKSTITNLLSKIYLPTEGEILLNNINLKEIPVKQIRDIIGTVTQETFLFSDTLKENIKFGNHNATEEMVKHAADIAQLSVDVRSFPKGFDTIVGERGITLSGGQKQRTSIARAVLKDPKIMMLDDALSAVDTQTEENILQGLQTVMQQRTTILISHRISTVKNADKILVLDEGEIIEQGSHSELLALKGKYHEIHELQIMEQELSQM